MKIYNDWNLLIPLFLIYCVYESQCGDNDYNVVHNDGSYEFGGDSPDSYHYADANRNNVVRGEFGGRNPKTGDIDRTIYTAGPRGFRPRGKNIVRNYDLNQNGPRPIGSPDDPYYDPYEDPSYQFGFRTRTHTREESANRVGDVTGKYSFVDDVGERHNVEYIAGRRTGFHVKTPFPDSNPRAYGPLYFRGRGRPIPRGRSSIQRGLDGSYRFVSAGPDQRRTEVSDASGHVRGSYTYLDDKGVQHSVHYIAGPETGYRVLKNVRGPHLPTVFPFGRPDIISPEFYDDFGKDVADVGDVFGDNSGSSKPGGGGPGGDAARPGGGGGGSGGGTGFGDGGTGFGDGTGGRPDASKPSGGGGSDYDDDYDLFGEGGKNKPGGSPATPTSTTGGYPSSTTPSTGQGDDGFGSTTPSYGGTSSPGYGGSSSTPGYGGGTPTPSFPGGTGDDAYPGDTGRPGKPITDYGPPGFGKPASGRPSPGDFLSGSSDGFDSNEIGGDFGLFGNAKPSRPTGGSGGSNYPNEGPSYQFGGGTGPDGRPCRKCAGTIVTNVGDRTFTVPPGVSVRAHVQAIDLIPYESKIPSPSVQMREDVRSGSTNEQLRAEEDQVSPIKALPEGSESSLNNSTVKSTQEETSTSSS